MVYTHLKVSVITCIVLCSVSAVLGYSGGSGTTEDPYQIGTVADWNKLMDTNSDWDANFVMTADINLQGVALIPVGNNINDTYYRFTGIFDGNGHVVRNAEINMRGVWHIGLFGVIDDNSQILNLGVEDVNMSGERDIAGLVGCNEGTITNCYATGKIGYNPGRNGYNLGGLVGLNYGTITGSHAACDVNGNTYGIGGLVGLNYATITDSYANGIVNGDRYVGGLVGVNSNLYDKFAHEFLYIGTISHCYATGSVSGLINVGGLAGTNLFGDAGPMWSWPSITESYSICSVTGGSSVGGLVGKNYFGKVIDCYATGEVSGNVGVGGLLGENHGQTVNCYAAGRVTGNGGGLISGPVGYPDAALNCFWDIEATLQTTSAGGTGLTTAEMKTLSTFTSAGWDFVGETANGPNDVWFIREGKEYPRFVWENNMPIANAGPNQVVYAWIDGIAEVTLDANNSYDADGDELTYLWKWIIDGNTYETNEVNPTIELPAGQYTFDLVVNDGLADSEPNHVVVTAVEPIKSTLCIAPKVINWRSNDRIMAMLRLPAGITRKQLDPRQKLLLYPGEIESSFQLVLPCGQQGAVRYYIMACFDKSELMDAVGKAGRVQLDVVGHLKTGQYFYGSDTVWIINPPPRRPNWGWWGRDFYRCDR